MRKMLVITTLLLANAAGAQTMTACDWEVAHPSDPHHVGPGVSSQNVNTLRAIAACEEAVASEPGEARFHYQLGRALVYHADREGSDWRIGLPHLERAADMKHTQAQFVLGLMYQREGRFCAAAETTRAAADAGLKAARIGYTNEFLADRLDECTDVASIDDMKAYLESAADQVNGWYENMLLDALRRGLAARADSQGD